MTIHNPGETFPGQPLALSWSYSALKNYETCPKRYYHYNWAKDVKEPETDALRSGNELHAHFEQRLKGTQLPLGYGQYEALLKRVIDAPGQTYGEQKLAITSSFAPVGFFARGVWLRVVIDAAKVNGDRATIFDWKTGRPSEDITQLQIMTAVVMHHSPAIARVKAALVFVNYDKIEPAEFVREDLTEIWGEILPRVKALEKARQNMEFPPKPSGLCKKYCAVVSCPFHGKGG